MHIVCRKAQPEDIPLLNPLLAQLSGSLAHPKKMAETMQKINRNPDAILLVAEDADTGALCGSLFGLSFEDICGTCQPILMIENVVTDVRHRRLGVGRMMFKWIENWGRERNCHYCILVSGMQRVEAHRFYDAIGYNEVKGFKKYL